MDKHQIPYRFLTRSERKRKHDAHVRKYGWSYYGDSDYSRKVKIAIGIGDLQRVIKGMALIRNSKVGYQAANSAGALADDCQKLINRLMAKERSERMVIKARKQRASIIA